MPQRFGVILLLAALGCGHDRPFRQEEFGTDRPYIAGPPRVLTANLGMDIDPAVLPDNSAFIYSFDYWYEPGDRCLGLIPVGQYRVSREICPRSNSLSHDRFALPAVSASGRLAFHLARSTPFALAPYSSAIVVSSMDIRDSAEIIPVPIRTPDGILHDSISRLTRLGWLRGDTLAILLSNRIYLVAGGEPRSITWLDTPGPVADFDTDGKRLFISLVGGSQLFRFDLDSRQPVPVHNFGTAGAINVIQVAGDRAAVLAGGTVYVADLTAHTQVALPGFGLAILRIALPEDGPELIAMVQDPLQSASDLVAFQLP